MVLTGTSILYYLYYALLFEPSLRMLSLGGVDFDLTNALLVVQYLPFVLLYIRERIYSTPISTKPLSALE